MDEDEISHEAYCTRSISPIDVFHMFERHKIKYQYQSVFVYGSIYHSIASLYVHFFSSFLTLAARSYIPPHLASS